MWRGEKERERAGAEGYADEQGEMEGERITACVTTVATHCGSCCRSNTAVAGALDACLYYLHGDNESPIDGPPVIDDE